MAGEALGHKSYIQIGLESIWGTAVAATRRLPIWNFRYELATGQILDRSLDDSVSLAAIYQGRRSVKGSFTTRLDYEGEHGLLWDSLFGTGTFGSVGAVTTLTGPYLHTFKEKSLLNSLSVQVIEGNIPTGKCTTLEGFKITGARVHCEQGDGDRGVAIVTWDFTAEDAVEDQTPTSSLTAAAALPCLYHEVTTWQDGSGDTATGADKTIRTRTFDLTIRNPVEEEGAIGQINIEEPQRNDYLVLEFVSTKIYKTKAAHARARAFTTSPVEIVFGAAASKRLTFEIDTAKIRTHRKPIDGYGYILETNEIVGSKDATLATALQLKVENTKAAAAYF